MITEQKITKEILALNDQLALGYESTLDFNFGYLNALYKHKIISKKQYNRLLQEHYLIDDDD